MLIKTQKGIGMVEVLIALLLLAMGVLGFSALQIRAVEATNEALNRVQAMNLARDLAERIRANRTAYEDYVTALTATTQATSTNPACVQTSTTNPCTTATSMANYDSAQIVSKANDLGFKISLPNCQVVSGGVQRRCVYVAWGKTKPEDSTDSLACTNGGSYLPRSQCLIMELY